MEGRALGNESYCVCDPTPLFLEIATDITMGVICSQKFTSQLPEMFVGGISIELYICTLIREAGAISCWSRLVIDTVDELLDS